MDSKFYISVRFVVASCHYSVDISSDPNCGGFCRLFRYSTDANDWIKEITGEFISEDAFAFVAQNGRDWQSWKQNI